MANEKTIEELAKEYANKAEDSAEAAEKSSQDAARSVAFISQFMKTVATFKATDTSESSSTLTKETKGKHIHDYLGDYDYYTGKASEINRSLALAGVAIVWLFRNPEGSKTLFPDTLLLPLWFLVTSLILDLLQYLLGSIFWGIFYEYKYHLWKRKKSINDEQAKDIEAPNALSIPLVIVFFAKIICMAIAYYKLFFFLQYKIQQL